MTEVGVKPEIARNPLVEKRADPWIIKEEGTYYYTGSYPEFDRIVLRGAPTLADLSTAPEVTIWTRPAEGEMGGNIWAPELHRIGGKWYFYFTAGHSEKPFRIRMYVLEGVGEDPLNATWGEPKKIETEWDEFSLDATVFEHRGTLYYVWAQRPVQDPSLPDGVIINSALYISKMSDPFTLEGSPVLITSPEYDWENVTYRVNEGAAVLKRNGRIFITFSASATDHNYCMGLLSISEDANLLDASQWTKSSEPVFESTDLTSAYGPGHNSFTVDENGRDILVYHARDYRSIDGNSLFDHNRHGRIQPFYFNAEGSPLFGLPVGDGAVPTRFQDADGSYLALRESSVVPAARGGEVLGNSWQRPAVELELERLTPAQAVRDDLSVTRTLFRVEKTTDSAFVLEPVAAPGQQVIVSSETFRPE